MNADLLKRLLDAGTPTELVAEVATELARANAGSEVLEHQRAVNRERQRAFRASHDVTQRNVTQRDERDGPSPLTPPLKTPPDPQKITPPITPQPQDVSAEPTVAPLSRNEVIEAWQSRMVPLGFPRIAKMTSQRERQLAARLKDSTLEDWQRAMDALERSAFCRGENDRGWRADFDFLLQPKSFTGLLEGKYDH